MNVMGFAGLKTFFVASFFLCSAFKLGLGCDPTLCTDPATCVLASDNRTCKCVSGHYGNQCKEIVMNVLCQKNYSKVMVVKDYFDYHNVKLENVHLLNKDCAAFEEVVSGITYFSAATRSDNYTLCGGRTPEKNVTHITYSNTLYSGNKTEGQIVRQPQVEIIFKCVYPYMRRVSLPFPIAPYSSEMVLRVKQLEATVVMRLYKSSTFKEAYTSTPVLHLRDRVYVGVQITDPENFFALRVNECWATQTPDPNASQSFNHVLIDNGCVKDETVTFLNGTDGRGGANGEGSAVYYSFDMFRFVVQPFDLYLHCRVQLCTPNYDEQCVPDCKPKAKREAGMEGSQQGLLSYGPIKIKVPEEQRSNLLLMVTLPACAAMMFIIFLFVLIAVAKAASKRTSQPTTIKTSFRTSTHC